MKLEDCEEIIDEGVAFLRELTGLGSLSLAGYLKITDKALGELTTLKRLTAFSLKDCAKITSFGTRVLKNFKQLAELDLAGCTQLTDLDLCKNLAGLQILSLAGLPFT